MIEIFCGYGSGKTSAAVGRAIRATGHGINVMFIQFLKDGSSGEISVLRKINGLKVLVPEESYGFVIDMTEEQIEKTRLQYSLLLKKVREFCIFEKAANNRVYGVIVLDEILHAYKANLIDTKELKELITRYKHAYEFILTGSVEIHELNELADYITCFSCTKHPFQFGQTAREGFEY